MKLFSIMLKVIAYLSLVATIGPPFAFLTGRISLDETQWIMCFAMIAWFVSASFLAVLKKEDRAGKTDSPTAGPSDESAVI